MRISIVAQVLLSACLGAEVLAKAPSMRNARKYKEHLQQREGRHGSFKKPVEKRQSKQFLTNATAPFAVDSSQLPNMTFAHIGESYAGLLPMDSSDKELFFWFVPTENPDASDEIVIWLNGGPGCSSLDGFLHENGPVVWMPGQFLPVQNTYAWNNLSNVVWVEQPVGTGYTRGTPNATSEADVAAQFLGFWKNFVDLFALQGRKVFVTGESYAGMYVPYISDAMVAKNDSQYFNLKGAMIYDPSIGSDIITEVVPTLAFVEYHHQLFPFTDATMAQFRNQSAACGFDEFMAKGLVFPPKGHFGPDPATRNGRFDQSCDIFDGVINEIFKLNPCFDIYQVGQLCPLLWDVEGFPYSDFFLPEGYDNPYFNRTDVKTVLHAPLDSNWMICSDVNVFPHGDNSEPSGNNGGPLARVAEATNNVIVGHGILDMVLLSNGSLLTLNNLTWNGAQGFSGPPNKPFYVPDHDDPNLGSIAGFGVYGSWVSERGLTFVEINLSGHMVPEFQPSAGYRTLELLLGRISNFSEVSPFSTQPGFPQPPIDLGSGTAPIKRQDL